MIVTTLAIILSLCLGIAVHYTRHDPRRRHSAADLETLRRDIERAEKSHAPRKHLRKQMVEAVRQELERA